VREKRWQGKPAARPTVYAVKATAAED
jgi:hypothetical protein